MNFKTDAERIAYNKQHNYCVHLIQKGKKYLKIREAKEKKAKREKGKNPQFSVKQICKQKLHFWKKGKLQMKFQIFEGKYFREH